MKTILKTTPTKELSKAIAKELTIGKENDDRDITTLFSGESGTPDEDSKKDSAKV